jgi:Holliday junction resolvasome RuvABC ATP-dependent DNA helicase subunit
MSQQMKIWFPEDTSPSEAEIALAFAPNNRKCSLNRVIVSKANEGNFRILRRFGEEAHRRFNRSCRGFNFGIYCPPGQGKTFIVKAWAETIGIPFVFVQSSGLKSTWDLFQQICKAFEKTGISIVPEKNEQSDYVIPPCIVFFDEAHEIREDLQRGALLNPMEPDDGFMHIKGPGKDCETIVVDCYNICWIAATTDPADLFDAFASRFLNAVEWVPAGKEELPVIIKAGLEMKVENGEIPFAPPLEACQIITQYTTVPRIGIHGFGLMAVLQKRSQPNDTWEEACKVVAADLQYDEWGMTRKQIMILSALGQRPVAKARLGDICKCRSAQVEKMELPGLQQYTNGGPFCVSISGRGMCVTVAGLKELDRRSIPHNGKKVTAEYFEAKR